MKKLKLNIQRFASSGTCYTNIADDSRFRVDWQIASQSTSTNSTVINWQLYAELGHNYYSNAVRVDYVSINGQTVFGGYTWSNLYVGHHQLSSGSLTISHNEDGNKNFNINLSGWTYSSNYYSGSQNFALNKINRYARTDSVSGSEIEGNFSVNYTKYLDTYTYKLRISIPSVELLERIDYPTSGTTFTLSQTTIDELYRYTAEVTQKNTVSLGFTVESWDSAGTTKLGDGNEVVITGRILNADPIFTDFDFEDINSTTLALTGDSSVNVNGYSNIRVTIPTADKAIAQKGATMTKYQFRVGNDTPIDIAYSDSESVSGTINNAPSGVFNVYAVDNRTNTTLVTKLATSEIAYTPIDIDPLNCKVERDNGGAGGTATLTLSGTIWNNSFGDVTNSITNVVVEYKETGSSTWLTSPTTPVPTVTNNTYSFSDTVGSQAQGNTFELNKSYDFRVTVYDELSSKSIQLTPMPSAIPNISLADDGVGIMCDYDDNLGGKLQIGGKKIDYLNDVKTYKQTNGYITFTAPFTGIIDLTASWSGWGYAGGRISLEVSNPSNNATRLAGIGSVTSGHDTTPIPLIAKAIYYVEEGNSYTFGIDINGQQGGNIYFHMIGILRRGQSV